MGLRLLGFSSRVVQGSKRGRERRRFAAAGGTRYHDHSMRRL